MVQTELRSTRGQDDARSKLSSHLQHSGRHSKTVREAVWIAGATKIWSEESDQPHEEEPAEAGREAPRTPQPPAKRRVPTSNCVIVDMLETYFHQRRSRSPSAQRHRRSHHFSDHDNMYKYAAFVWQVGQYCSTYSSHYSAVVSLTDMHVVYQVPMQPEAPPPGAAVASTSSSAEAAAAAEVEQVPEPADYASDRLIARL